jgi:hypothetical protein
VFGFYSNRIIELESLDRVTRDYYQLRLTLDVVCQVQYRIWWVQIINIKSVERISRFKAVFLIYLFLFCLEIK